jgi:hypothetical protein
MAAVLLFLATATVVIWQNSRLAVLWDLSYILENSYRISLGDVPYRDFPLAHAPLTFLIQAMLMKLTGRVFFHHVLYCAAVGGLATVLTWRILWNLLGGAVDSAWWMAFLLSVPLSMLGIYCIFPHPFYDPDCTFAILVCIFFLQRLDRKDVRPVRAFLTGMVLVVPLFAKQNTGLAFLGSTAVMLALLIVFEVRCGRPVAGYLWLIAGLGTALASALLLIDLTVGLANYIHWTVQYAASRRMPRLADILSVYQEHLEPPWWVAAFVVGALLRWLNRRGTRVLASLSSSLMSLPFAWTLTFQFTGEDSSDRAERLLGLWPFLLIVAFVFALLRARRRMGIDLAMPFIVIGTIHGGFLSQQLWGSSYAMWPLLMLLIGSTVTALPAPVKERSAWQSVVLTCVVAIAMLVSGGFYVVSHERLDYAKLSGAMTRSTLPALVGLRVRGPWIPQFEQLVRFTEQEIPKQDGMLMIPGEDLFYYTTGRNPRFPVLVFDHTVNPYSPEQILELSRSRNIDWLVVKRKVQLDQDPVEDKDRLLTLLCQDFKQVESFDNYDVYRRPRRAAPLSATADTIAVAGSPLHR